MAAPFTLCIVAFLPAARTYVDLIISPATLVVLKLAYLLYSHNMTLNVAAKFADLAEGSCSKLFSVRIMRDSCNN